MSSASPLLPLTNPVNPDVVSTFQKSPSFVAVTLEPSDDFHSFLTASYSTTVVPPSTVFSPSGVEVFNLGRTVLSLVTLSTLTTSSWALKVLV